jgi:dTMP kinase
MSFFITFEGGEGCGKSLQSRNLYQRLVKTSISTILIREPGGTLLGQKIRYILKQACDIPISPLTELFLFNASRCQLVQDVIQPALKEGKVVICDRFSDSTIAYQSYGRELDLSVVKQINQLAVHSLKPDLTILLDVPPEIGLSRKKSGTNDRFEKETLEFHRKVREGFLKLAAEEPQRWIVIDSLLSPDRISDLIWQKVSFLLNHTRFIE